MRSATSIRGIRNVRRSSSTLVGSKEYLPLATFFLAATGAFLTPPFILYGKIDSSMKEIKDDNASFRSEIIKLHSDISKNIATLKERSNMKPPI